MIDKGMYEDVAEFNHKFNLPMPNKVTPLDKKTMEYRLGFLAEELSETIEAAEKGDMSGIADGLVDLVYVAIGTAIFMGLPWHELWDEVQRANMAKVPCLRPEDSKRNNKYDIIKPEGWVPPDIEGILISHVTQED